MKRKLIIGYFGVFFIVLIMISSATAIPVSNSKAFIKKVNKIEKIQNIFDENEKIFNKVKISILKSNNDTLLIRILRMLLALSLTLPVLLGASICLLILNPIYIVTRIIVKIMLNIIPPEEVDELKNNIREFFMILTIPLFIAAIVDTVLLNRGNISFQEAYVIEYELLIEAIEDLLSTIFLSQANEISLNI
jgi:hypothetical protein